MSCVLYNIIKEGHAVNLTTTPVDKLTDGQILALYDGDPTTPAVTISGTASLGLLVEYGEAYDVCYVDYHTDETVPSNLSIKYGTTSGTENVASISLHTAGVYRATVNDIARFVELRHTLTAASTDINQLDVIAVRLETVGFGDTISTPDEQLPLTHATIGSLSASPNIIPLFNDNPTDEVVKIAITPTLTKEDQYLYLATEEDGPYYGIDDHGFQQPGPDPMLLADDTMFSEEVIHPQWIRRAGYNKNTITPTAEGIIIKSGFYRHSGISNYTCRGLLTKDYFKPHSFTAEIQVRFLGYTGDYFASRIDSFVFALTNGALIGDINFYQGYTTDGRVGMSTGGVGITRGTYNGDSNYGTTDAFASTFAYTDGTSINNLRYTAAHLTWPNIFIDGGAGGNTKASYKGRSQSFNSSGFEDIANVGASMGDFTPNSEWHTWRLSYDHTKQELSGYIDKFFMGSCVFKADKFHSGCKLFIGSQSRGGLDTQIRNFKLYPNKVYKIKNIALPTNGAVFSASQNGEAANIAKLNNSNSNSFYVAPFPDTSTRIRVDFDKKYDIISYDMHQRHQGEHHSDGGAIPNYNGTKYYVKNAIGAIVDYGGKAIYNNVYHDSTDDWYQGRYTEKRTPTWSGGSSPTISGIDYIEWNFTEYDTGWPGPTPNVALTIGKIDVMAEYWYDVLDVPEEPDPKRLPWFKGRWYNLRQAGADGALHIRDPSLLNVSWYPTPQYLLHNVDFGFSSAAYSAGTDRRHDHTELLFASTGNAHSGNYTAWYSDDQPNEEVLYLWRYFPVETDVSLIYVACGLHPSYRGPKDFKFQYLNEGGNPNVDTDWIDIPPITRQHHKTALDCDLRYGGYKQELMNRNDGEWYTDVDQWVTNAGQPGGYGKLDFGRFTNDTSLNVLEDLVSLRHRGNDGVRMYSGDQPGQFPLVEPDVPVRTRGIRFVCKNPATSYRFGGNYDDLSVYEFHVFGKEGAGAYTSPVFDTGTPQNTERLAADLHTPAGTRAAVYVRSAPVPPTEAYDINFEVWSPLGALGDKGGVTPPTPTNYNRCISIGDETHFLFSSHYVYNHVTDTWSQPYGGYPAHSSGDPSSGDGWDTADLGSGVVATIRPDDRVDDYAALVDNVIYLAAEETTNTGSLRIMFLDLNAADPHWEALKTQRPPQTADAAMVAYDRKLYFFHEDGDIFYWDLVTSNWVLLPIPVPTNGSNRDRAASAVYNGKIYIFGVNEDTTRAHRVDILDPVKLTFTPGTSSPRGMRISQAITVGNIIYLLPKSSDAYMRYYPDEDRWEVCVSLHYASEYGGGTAYVFFLQGKYLYRVGAGYQGLARALVEKPVWEHGEVPSPIDPVWGGESVFTNLPWQRIGGLGELMPQNRYFQYKVELYCDSWVNPGNGKYPDLYQPAVENSPSLKSVKIITPQEMTIPASGTANAYLKIQASEEGDFRVWYTGQGRLAYGSEGGHNYTHSYSEDWVTMYTSSTTPDSWPVSTTASGFNGGSGIGGGNFPQGRGTRSPWVLPDGVGGYDVWFCRANVSQTVGQYNFERPQIYYVNTKQPGELSANNAVEQLVVPAGTLTETNGAIWHPTVVLTSGTNYKMWFTAVDVDSIVAYQGPKYNIGDERAIGFCESTDKINWTAPQIVISKGEDLINLYDADRAYRPCVLYDEGVYRIWYTGVGADGAHRVLYRESDDGISWGPIHLHVDKDTHGTADTNHAYKPHVIKDVDSYYLFYFGSDGVAGRIIRLQSPDGVDWTNPVIVMDSSGLQGVQDSQGVVDFFALIERPPVVPGTVSVTARLKIHNKGTAT